MSKKISVCMATYNGAPFIEAQLRSILSGLKPEDEVIVSDDHSTDDTIRKVEEIGDDRIRIVFNKPDNKGHITNFENALYQASGDIIFLSDQDDIWHSDKVAAMTTALEKCDLVVSDCYVVDEAMNVIHESFFELYNSGSGLIKNLVKNTYLGCCMAFNRKVLDKALPFPKDIISHDTWLGLIAELVGKSVFIEDKLHYFIRHGSNFSVSGGTDAMSDQISPYSFWQKISMRLVLIKNLIFRKFR